MYTVHQRNQVFETLFKMVVVLVNRLDEVKNVVGLDARLLNEMVKAGLRCPAFNPRMKYRLAEAGRDTATLQRMLPGYVECFPFDTLTCLMPFDEAALEVGALNP